MYKTTSRNMQSRAFRSPKAGLKKFRVRVGKPKRSSKVRPDPKLAQQTEPELVGQLGVGRHYAVGIIRRFGHQFAKLSYDPKRCSAFLNIVAQVRMIDGGLWTDTAIKSVLRRVVPKGTKKACSKKS